jgi:vacuolar-type H+-ATPase subunit I/STV1
MLVNAYSGEARYSFQKLATRAGYQNWSKAQQAMSEIVDVISRFTECANELDIQPKAIDTIQKTLEQHRKEISTCFEVIRKVFTTSTANT